MYFYQRSFNVTHKGDEAEGEVLSSEKPVSSDGYEVWHQNQLGMQFDMPNYNRLNDEAARSDC
jgi:hypothetical protein